MARFFSTAARSPDLGSALTGLADTIDLNRKQKNLKAYGNEMLSVVSSLSPEEQSDPMFLRQLENKIANKYDLNPEERKLGGSIIQKVLQDSASQTQASRNKRLFDFDVKRAERGERQAKTKEDDQAILKGLQTQKGRPGEPYRKADLSFDAQMAEKRRLFDEEDREHTLKTREQDSKRFDFNQKIDKLKLSNEGLRQSNLFSSQKETKLNKEAEMLFTEITNDSRGDDRAIQTSINAIKDRDLRLKVIKLFNRANQLKIDSLTQKKTTNPKDRKAWIDQFNKEIEFSEDRDLAIKNTNELLGYSILEPKKTENPAEVIDDPKLVFENVLDSFNKNQNDVKQFKTQPTIEQMSVDQIRDLKNIKTRFGKTETASTTPLTAIQSFASQSQPDKSPLKQFGETEIEAALRYTGITTKLQDRKEIAKILRQKFPKATNKQIADMIIASVTPTTK